MTNPKTRPSPPPPQPETNTPLRQGSWLRKCDLDAWLDRHLPVPTQVISNEEYLPIPQTPQQRLLEQEIVARAERQAAWLGMDRRRFLRSSCGMALAFAAMNTIFGRFFRVDAAELFEPSAVAENKTRVFIFDVQTHHVAMPSQAPSADQDFLRALLGLRNRAREANPALRGRAPKVEDLYLENYIKEVFLDSETDVAGLSALPGASEDPDVLPPDVIYKSRSWINELTRSPRVVSHGYFSPDLGQQNLEYMNVQAEKLKIDAWKGYTGVARAKGKQSWRMDDEKLAYPALEAARKMKITNICLHKGLPFPGDPQWWSPMDVTRAAKDFPDLNFLVYHSGFKSLQEALPAAEDGFKKTAYIPWVSDLCEWKKKNPQVNNIYMELGSTFGMMVITHPLICAHVLGMIIQAFGADHVLWGTDSVWWGSPQWQIEALRRLEMPEQLNKQFGYAPLTAEVKRQIFGLNAARLYGVDPAAKRNSIPSDYIDRLKQLYKQSGDATPSNTQYGWVAA